MTGEKAQLVGNYDLLVKRPLILKGTTMQTVNECCATNNLTGSARRAWLKAGASAAVVMGGLDFERTMQKRLR